MVIGIVLTLALLGLSGYFLHLDTQAATRRGQVPVARLEQGSERRAA